MRQFRPLLRKRGSRSELIVFIGLSVNAKEDTVKPKKHPLEIAKESFESARSIALSILIFVGGLAATVAIGREVFSNDILIDVTEISQQIANSGVSVTTLAAELAARVRALQAEAESQKALPAAELAYLLQSENKTKALPTLPSSTQKLLIDHAEPIPELISSAADSKVRAAIDYIRHVFGHQDNRLSVVLTSTEEKLFEARLRLRRKGIDEVTTISKGTVDELLIEIPRWLAKQLFPEDYIVALFARERREKDRNFSQTKAIIQELGRTRGGLDDIFLRTILGDIAFHKESYAEASAIYRSVIQDNPRFRDLVIYRLSQALIADSKLYEAVSLLSKEINDLSSSANSERPLTYLALLYAQSLPDSHARSVSRNCEVRANCLSIEAVIKRLEGNSPSSASLSNALGVLRYQDGDMENAERLFELARRLDPRYPSALNNLGIIQLKKQNAGAALLLLQSASAISEDSGVIQLNIGNTLESFGRFEEAAQYFATAASLDRENLVCHTCWALSLLNSYRIDEALSAVRSGLSLDPGNASLLLVSGLISSKLGCYREAAESYEATLVAKDSRVNMAMIYRNYGDALVRLGRRKEAIQMFQNEERALRFSSDTADILNEIISRIYAAGRRYDQEAIKEFYVWAERAQIDDPGTKSDVSSAYGRLAEALLWIGKPDRALEAARRAVLLDAKDWEKHHTLGRVYSAIRKGSLARNEFRLALLLGGDKDVRLLADWNNSLRNNHLPSEVKRVRAEFKIHPHTCIAKDI
ncbi:hypothetical protein JCM14076_12830 [Methylosoma difficile]